MLNKLLILLLVILLSPLIAGLYGGLHDQVTFSISPEYFTKFKFYQFGLDEIAGISTRVKVGVVGFLATWWFGLPIGMILGLTGLMHANAKQMLRYVMIAFVLAIAVAAATPAIAVPLELYGLYFNGTSYESYQVNLPLFVPAGIYVQDAFAFHVVGLIHAYSYLGGLMGMLCGITYQVIVYRKRKRLAIAIN